MSKSFHLSIPISKIDEEQRMVWGYATVEEIDKHGEIIGYDASKVAFSNWVGNIREMHAPVAVGKSIEITFDDDKKGVWLGAKISESVDGENAWTKVKEGILAGYSIGGIIKDYTTVPMNVGGKKKDVLMVTEYELSEVSLVDNPACPSAMLEVVKSVGGHLQRTETMQKGDGRPAAWWESAFHFAPGQVMTKRTITYNKDDMTKQPQLKKNIWRADWLIYLCGQLADYIWGEAYDGEPTEDLIAALNTLKEAARSELSEDENWPVVVATAVELAAKTLNLTKSQLEEKMSKEVSKAVIGQPDRDADGKETVAAAVEAEVEALAETAEVEDPKAPEAPAEEEEKPKKKAASETDDLQKSMHDSLLKSVGAVVEAAVAPLVERLTKLESEPAAPKAKANFVEKSEEPAEETKFSKMEAELKETLDRMAVLAKDATAGDAQERVALAVKQRKLVRMLDPKSAQQVAEIKASFVDRD